ncbi:MAG: Hsp33 family molecular chaperone HslO [Erysipelotrichaceae bacterium]|nr:Hsp33 family molecular chaperone HslO [Erysipelotrichaceae bacterium]MBQ9987607.1 Hsp33 family molecular chaperone HslO [Erysipelotrichales bacterium]MBR3694331.1 Hsp33 family molecular chaperone HslO [Erysipelotrichales bacterium]
MKDTLIRAISNEHNFRLFVTSTTHLSDEARRLHDMWPTATAALSRVMSVGVIMGSMLKDENEHLNIEIEGGGPIGKMMVDARYDGTVRGFVGDPHVHYEYNDTHKLAVGIAVGSEGTLKVIKGMGLKSDFSGQVPLVSGEIGEDFAYYFTVSEQTPSAVSVGCLVDVDNSVMAAGGLIIQVLPEATEEDITYMEEALGRLQPVSEMIHNNMTPTDIAKLIDPQIEILEEREVAFKCGCSREKMESALFTLTNKDRQEMIEESDGCDICCHFCNTSYHFTGAELQAMNEEIVRRFQALNQANLEKLN